MTVYSTSFPAPGELPISQGGKWSNPGLDWTLIRLNGTTNHAYGVQNSGSGNADDSISVLSGAGSFAPDVTVTGVIFLDPTLSGNTHEVELFVRMNISAHVATGYECNLAFDGGYTQIVRWNGALNDFTMLKDQQPSGVLPKTGDIFKVTIVGNIIRVFINGVQINTVDVSVGAGAGNVWATGNPGMAFWHGDDNDKYAFTSWSADDGAGVTIGLRNVRAIVLP